ncbi:MAG: hypothetical protein RLZZ546_1664 [Bacteroidota bacterium]|jgi:glyoxylase-like metal-dependent hydrolase (beta-lactamase superfamily II)
MTIHSFTFNDFQENTYIIIDEDTKNCIIVDPGCNGTAENFTLSSFIDKNDLTPIQLINTHCHIDHVLGNQFVADKYGIELTAHQGEVVVLSSCERVAKMYGIPFVGSPPVMHFLEDGDIVKLGKYDFEVLLCPGHSPASICLYNAYSKILIAGDVLFHRSIGRTDLPGGNYDTLIESIKTKLWHLPKDTKVYSGHGPHTTIGEEILYNPFLHE